MAHILLAEDDGSMCKFLAAALERAGHTVTARNNGLEALAALESLEDSNAYDLLLTDIIMPGMDGIELAQSATKKCPDLKVMFITGFAAVALEQRQLSGNNDNTRVISKPFHLNELINQIETLLQAA